MKKTKELGYFAEANYTSDTIYVHERFTGVF